MIDVLLVVDNSGSMREEQEKLASGLKGLLDGLRSAGLTDYHIGVVTTDVDDPKESGRLQGTPSFVTGKMKPADALTALTSAVKVGTGGTSYERPLDAMRKALSSPLSTAHNKGFLRARAALAVLFLGDEDDCSHNGSIPEGEYDSEVCRLSREETLNGPDGKAVLDSKGQPIKGQSHHLVPVATFVRFLLDLKKDSSAPVFAGAIIGDPQGVSKSTPHGGCAGAHGKAYGGFRLLELVEGLAEGRAGKRWYSVCADENGFADAVRSLMALVGQETGVVRLGTRLASAQGLGVSIVRAGGETVERVPPAQSTTRSCSHDGDCGEGLGCSLSTPQKCYQGGWLPITKNKVSGVDSIQFLGRYRQVATGGGTLKLSWGCE